MRSSEDTFNKQVTVITNKDGCYVWLIQVMPLLLLFYKKGMCQAKVLHLCKKNGADAGSRQQPRKERGGFELLRLYCREGVAIFSLKR